VAPWCSGEAADDVEGESSAPSLEAQQKATTENLVEESSKISKIQSAVDAANEEECIVLEPEEAVAYLNKAADDIEYLNGAVEYLEEELQQSNEKCAYLIGRAKAGDAKIAELDDQCSTMRHVIDEVDQENHDLRVQLQQSAPQAQDGSEPTREDQLETALVKSYARLYDAAVENEN
jgi:chromosome segregation ATPase